jgi:hypothetical protein
LIRVDNQPLGKEKIDSFTEQLNINLYKPSSTLINLYQSSSTFINKKAPGTQRPYPWFL